MLTNLRSMAVIWGICLGFPPVVPAQTGRPIYRFTSPATGEYPVGGLTEDAQGILYGTTEGAGCGTVFALKGTAQGFAESVVWTFQSTGASDGCTPNGNLIFDSVGNLYGTTSGGGTLGFGTVFELSPNGNGGWVEEALWNFGGVTANLQDGQIPEAGLAIDAAGNLYGTTSYGGGVPANGCGTVFELSPQEGGGWAETILHGFAACFETGDGLGPAAGVTLDGAGNIYGTTVMGGYENDEDCSFGCGTVFELERAAGWQETQLTYSREAATAIIPTLPSFSLRRDIWSARRRSAASTWLELLLSWRHPPAVGSRP